MVVAAGHRLRFYRSDDLLDWTPTSTLTGLSDAGLGVVETPELVELEVFAAAGTVVLSDLVLPAPVATGIRIDRVPVGARILHLDVGQVTAGDQVKPNSGGKTMTTIAAQAGKTGR